MLWLDVRQLKSLRRFPVPPEVLKGGRQRLLIVMSESPMTQHATRGFFEACRVAKLYAAAWRPVMAAMIVIVTVTGGGTFAAAHDALPGEKLYVVKIFGEEFRERMTLTSEQRFVVQAAHASRRLAETERLLSMQGIDGDARAARVREAMDRYEGHVFVMNEIAVRLEPDPEKPKKGKKAYMAAESMFDRHVKLMESATHAESVVVGAMLDPLDAAFSLEADMHASIPADDGGEDGEDARHRRERAERVSESLKRMRAGLESRKGPDAPGEEESRRDEDRRADGRDIEDGREEKEWVETESSFDFKVENPLEIRFGM